MPIIRYTFFVGSLLLGMLFLLGDVDKPAGSSGPDRWTSVDSLRAMAHLGEPVHGARIERAHPEPASGNAPVETTVQERPLIMNAQANMDFPKAASRPAAAKPRKARIAARQVRVHTAAAENAPRTSLEEFRPPSW